MNVELTDIQQSQQWINLNETTEKCLKFVNSLYDSTLMKEYNVSSMSDGYKMRRSGIDSSQVVNDVVFRNEIERRFKELYSQHENKVEKLTKQHQTEVVSHN